jgi:hypothetical protein
MKVKCDHEIPKTKTNRSFMCGAVTESSREQIFLEYWKLDSWSAKKAFVRAMVSTRLAKRRRKMDKKSGQKEKKQFHDCYLPDSKGEKVRVCKKLFLATLSLGKDQFMRWCERAEQVEEEEETESNSRNSGHAASSNSRMDRRRTKILEWLELLPKVGLPSHYCRATSQKVLCRSLISQLSTYA